MVKNKMKKWFQRDNLIIVILAGILLLVIALPTGNNRKNTEKDAGDASQKQMIHFMGDSTESLTSFEDLQVGEDFMAKYEKSMEERLKTILEGMAGAGKVEVMITFASSKELVVEKDRPMTRSNITENDGEGGARTTYQMDSGEATVYSGESSDREPYVIKTLTPKVEGVLVAAQGAGSGDVTKNITEAIQALFGLEAHKIKVIRMKSS